MRRTVTSAAFAYLISPFERTFGYHYDYLTFTYGHHDRD